MATHDVVSQPAGKVLTATETVVLGDGVAGSVSRWYLWVEEADGDTFDWSIAVKGSPAGSGRTSIAVAYQNLTAPGTDVNAAITAAGQFLIEASGMDIELVCTRTAGTIRVIASPLRG